MTLRDMICTCREIEEALHPRTHILLVPKEHGCCDFSDKMIQVPDAHKCIQYINYRVPLGEYGELIPKRISAKDLDAFLNKLAKEEDLTSEDWCVKSNYLVELEYMREILNASLPGLKEN